MAWDEPQWQSPRIAAAWSAVLTTLSKGPVSYREAVDIAQRAVWHPLLPPLSQRSAKNLIDGAIKAEALVFSGSWKGPSEDSRRVRLARKPPPGWLSASDEDLLRAEQAAAEVVGRWDKGFVAGLEHAVNYLANSGYVRAANSLKKYMREHPLHSAVQATVIEDAE